MATILLYIRQGITMSNKNANPVEHVLQLFRERGNSQYGQEAVSQVEHALQTAALAVRADADAALITAALLHDVGHLLHDLPDDAPDQGIDDRHEVAGGRWLESRFVPEVVDPVRLHVPSKRYLCSIDPTYYEQLSPPSQHSLKLQGGPMSADEAEQFSQHPHLERALQLRRWDDEAKVPDLKTPELDFFEPFLAASVIGGEA